MAGSAARRHEGDMTYVLIPGAGGSAWYWHRLVPILRARGHDVVAVDLPAADERAGLAEYAETVVRAIGRRDPSILVAQSLAGFTAPLVCERKPVALLVLLNAMIPTPGESAGEWWSHTGHTPPGDDFDPISIFFHDLPPDVTAEALKRGAPAQSNTPFGQPWPLASWPDVPTRVLQARDDRLFDVDCQRRVASERLGIALEEMPGGHLVALSRPEELADRLENYRAQLVKH
jgi:pimeloyl-ACP methyl ester carboxylesterase